MKQFLKTTGLFTILLPISYIGCMAILVFLFPNGPNFLNIYYKSSYGHSHTRLQEIKIVEDIDILFIWPSTTYMGFDTRIFEKAGYKVFNLGTSAQTPIQTNVLLQRYLEQLSPKLVVYNPHPGTFIIDGTEAATDLFSNDIIDKHALKMLWMYPNPITINTFIFSYIAELSGIKETYNEPFLERDDTYISGGYVSRSTTISNNGNHSANSMNQSKNGNWKPLESQIQSFEQIISFLKKTNTDYILVQPPVHSEYYQNSVYSTPDVKTYFEQFGTYIDFNTRLNLEDSIHLADYTVHLNQRGVEAFNNYILENNILPIN